jgi:hypothetical protein
MNSGKYKHGVGMKGAVDKTSGKRVTTFTRDNQVHWRYSTWCHVRGMQVRGL